MGVLDQINAAITRRVETLPRNGPIQKLFFSSFRPKDDEAAILARLYAMIEGQWENYVEVVIRLEDLQAAHIHSVIESSLLNAITELDTLVGDPFDIWVKNTRKEAGV